MDPVNHSSEAYEVATPYIAPRLTLRVGVSGHRPNKLSGIDIGLIERRAEDVLDHLAKIIRLLQTDVPRITPLFAGGKATLRFATAIAEGADTLVARAAARLGYQINLTLPFRKAVYAQDFTGNALQEFEGWCSSSNEAVATCTELHVSDIPHDPMAYRAAGRLMLAHSDVLITVWDERKEEGEGGTAEIVREAQRRGLLIILITLEGALKIWNVPDASGDPLKDGSWQLLNPLLANSKVDLIAEKLKLLLLLPKTQGVSTGRDNARSHSSNAARKCLLRFSEERFHESSRAFGFALLQQVFLLKPLTFKVNYHLADLRKHAWKTTLKVATQVGGGEFCKELDTRLRQRWLGADNLAIHYANKFRTAFVTNFALAALAVFVGLLTLFWADSQDAKAAFTLIEVALIGAILVKTHVAHKNAWHDRWVDYRRLAEALRPSRLPILVGSSPARPGLDASATPGQDWTVWYARASLRELPPPNGVVDAIALKVVIDVAIEEEIGSQVGYHRHNVSNLERLDHNLEVAAESALWITLATSCAYLVLFFASTWLPLVGGWVKVLKPFATFLGGTLPVIGAAIFGIRATADFRTGLRQSQQMLLELKSLEKLLDAASIDPERFHVEQLFGQVSRTLSDDLKTWGMIYSERELVPGF